jgi:hypothetical protein
MESQCRIPGTNCGDAMSAKTFGEWFKAEGEQVLEKVKNLFMRAMSGASW